MHFLRRGKRYRSKGLSPNLWSEVIDRQEKAAVREVDHAFKTFLHMHGMSIPTGW